MHSSSECALFSQEINMFAYTFHCGVHRGMFNVCGCTRSNYRLQTE